VEERKLEIKKRTKEKKEKRVEEREENHKNNYIALSIFVTLLLSFLNISKTLIIERRSIRLTPLHLTLNW
jgi:hypothetical protein